MNSKNDLIKFYKSLTNINYNDLTEERIKEINTLVSVWKEYFNVGIKNIKSLIFMSAHTLLFAKEKIGLKNDAEVIYFFIQMVDPSFMFLEAYECANTKEELKELCLKNFELYDPIIINFEKSLNKLFNFINIDDLWTRDSIKR